MTATVATQTFENIIKGAASGSAWAYEASTGALDVQFGATIGTTNAVQITTTDGHVFSWKPDTVNVIDTAGNVTQIDAVNANAAAQVWQNKLSYIGTTPATSDEFTVDGARLKHDVRMVAPPMLPSGYSTTPEYLAIGGDVGSTAQDWTDVYLFANGAAQTVTFTTTGDLSFRLKSTGKEIYKIPAVSIMDDAGNVQSGGYLVEFGANDAVSLYMLAPWQWMQSAQFPVVIDPTVVSAFDNIPPRGFEQSVIRLSNGDIVAAILVGGLTFYKSSDGGQTWAQLCTFNPVSGTSAGHATMVASSTTLTAIVSVGTSLYWVQFDESTVTNTNLSGTANSGAIAAPSGTTISTFAGLSLVIDSAGNYQMLVSLKTSSANLYVMYVSTSTDGKTWGALTALTAPTAYSISQTNGSVGFLIPLTNGNMVAVFMWSSESGGEYKFSNYIYALQYTGGAWSTTPITVATGSSGANYNGIAAPWFCGLVDGNGKIRIYNNGGSASYATIFEYASTDGGTTWTSTEIMSGGSWYLSNTTGYAQMGVTLNPLKGDIYLIFTAYPSTGTLYEVVMIKYTASTGTWGAVTVLQSYSTGSSSHGAQAVGVFWSAYSFAYGGAVQYIWSENITNTVDYGDILLDNPPNAPTLVTESNFDATTSTAFGWTFSDPDPGDYQSSYELQIVDVAAGTTVVDTGKVASTSSTYTLAANTLTNGKSYQWRVTTWDSQGEQGPYSAYSSFNTAAAPTVTVTNPTSGAVIATTSITASWSYSDPGNNAQQSYRVELLDSTDASVLADSGVITSSGGSYTIQYALANNTTYYVKVTVTSAAGISASADDSFSTSFTTPAQPTIAVTPDNTSANVTIAITNPAPSGSEPTLTYNDLYRRETGTTTWTRIATQLAASATYTDYALASSIQHDYKVTASGSNGTQTDSAVASGVAVDLRGTWLHDVSDPAGTQLSLPYFWNQTSLGGQTPNGEQWTPTATQLQFAGRTDPVFEFGEAETYQVTKGALTIQFTDEEWAKLANLLRNQTTLCLRDSRGRKVFGNVVGYQEVDLNFGNQVQTLTITQSAYSEAV